MSKTVDLVTLFSEYVSKAETLVTSAQNEPLGFKASKCVSAFTKALNDLRAGNLADTNFSDSHANTKHRTDLTRAVADIYGFTLGGADSPHKKYNPIAFQIFEELKEAANALYSSGNYKKPHIRKTPEDAKRELAV